MGDVIQFGSSGISIEDFNNELKNPDAFERVATSIASICGFDSYTLNIDEISTRIRFNSPENDVLSHVRGEFNKLLVSVPASFPSELVDDFGVEPQTALELATDFSLAYGQYCYAKKKWGYKPSSFVTSQVDEVWNSRYLGVESRAFVPPYRFAGTVALQSAKVFKLPNNNLRNQPPHIAGIINPLTRTEARTLHGLLRA